MDDQKVVGIQKRRKGNINMKNDQKGDCGSGSTESEHNRIHIWTERERRKKMRNMFSSLRDLLPLDKLPLKADKSSIVDEAVKHIKTLEQTLQALQIQSVNTLPSNASATSTIGGHDYVPYYKKKPHPDQSHDQSRELFLADYHQGNYLRNFIVARDESDRVASYQTWFSPNVVINMCGDEAQISICSPRKPGILAIIFYILEKHNLDVISAHISSDGYRCVLMIHARASGISEEFARALSVEDVFRLAAGEINMWILSGQ